MNSRSISLQTFWRLLTDPTPEQKEVIGEARPFLFVLTVLMALVSVLVILDSPTMHTPGRLILFAVLMAVHLGLHWLSAYSIAYSQWRIPYLVVQGVLAFGVTLLAGAPALGLAAFCALIGETLGMYGTTRLGWSAVIVYLILMPLSYWLIGGQTALDDWLSPTISTSIILIIFMVLLRRQLDASQRAQALAAELETTNRQLVDYAAQVETLTLAAERERMARELHDTLAQGLAGLILQLEAVKAHLAARRSDRAGQIVEQALARARSALADARAAIDDLRVEVTSADLAESVRREVNRFTTATGVPCDLDLALPAAGVRMPDTLQEHAKRAVAESLANVVRHARATHARVVLRLEGEVLEIEVRDDGIGFDPTTATRAGHYGLRGMRERARLAGGTIAIDSGTGKGTCIKIHLPLNQAVHPANSIISRSPKPLEGD